MDMIIRFVEQYPDIMGNIRDPLWRGASGC